MLASALSKISGILSRAERTEKYYEVKICCGLTRLRHCDDAYSLSIRVQTTLNHIHLLIRMHMEDGKIIVKNPRRKSLLQRTSKRNHNTINLMHFTTPISLSYSTKQEKTTTKDVFFSPVFTASQLCLNKQMKSLKDPWGLLYEKA